MTPRRLISLFALSVLLLSSGCCHHRCHSCRRVVLFPRLHAARCESAGGECGCATCCHSADFAGPHPLIAPGTSIITTPGTGGIPLQVPRQIMPTNPTTN